MKHILDLTKEERDEMTNDELDSIAWQSGMNLNIWNARIAKLREFQKLQAEKILLFKEGEWQTQENK